MGCSTSHSTNDIENIDCGQIRDNEDAKDPFETSEIIDINDHDDYDAHGNLKSLDSDDEEEDENDALNGEMNDNEEKKEDPEPPYNDSKLAAEFETTYFSDAKCHAYLWYISPEEWKSGEKKHLRIEPGLGRLVSDFACHNDAHIRSRSAMEMTNGELWTKVYDTYHPWEGITGL